MTTAITTIRTSSRMRSLRGSGAAIAKQKPPVPVPVPSSSADEGADYDDDDGTSSLGGGSVVAANSGSAGATNNGIGGRDQPLFLRKTYQMLESCSPSIAAWSGKGDSFLIKDPDSFAQTVIPQYFSHNNFSSFVRQLNFYGFRKVKQDVRVLQGGSNAAASSNPANAGGGGGANAKWWEFRHDKFIRGKPQLLAQIRRATHGASNEQEVSHLKTEVGQLKDRIQEMSSDIDRLTSLVQGLMVAKMGSEGADPKKRKVSADRAAAAAVMVALEGQRRGRKASGRQTGGRREGEEEDAEEEEEEESEGEGGEAGAGRMQGPPQADGERDIQEGLLKGTKGLPDLSAMPSTEGEGNGSDLVGAGLGLLGNTCSADSVLAFQDHSHLFLSGQEEEDGEKLSVAFDHFLGVGLGGEEDGRQNSASAAGPSVEGGAGGEKDFALSILELDGEEDVHAQERGASHGLLSSESLERATGARAGGSLSYHGANAGVPMETSPPGSPRPILLSGSDDSLGGVAMDGEDCKEARAGPAQEGGNVVRATGTEGAADVGFLPESLTKLSPEHKKRLLETLVTALGTTSAPSAPISVAGTEATGPVPATASCSQSVPPSSSTLTGAVPPLASAAFGALLTQYAKELVESDKPPGSPAHLVGHHHHHHTRKEIRSQG